VISHRRPGGSPDLRVPCVFGQRLDGYHPVEGLVVVFYFTLALFQVLRVGKNPASDQRVSKAAVACQSSPPRSGPLEAAPVQTPYVEVCCQARVPPNLGGGGLWVCMRRPHQLYGPRGMSARAAGANLLVTFLSELGGSCLALVCARVRSSVRSVLESHYRANLKPV
jgi:hypothetical protein